MTRISIVLSHYLIAISSLALIVLSLSVHAQKVADNDPNAVLIKSQRATVTRDDYDTELERLPPDMREAFGQNPNRIIQLVNNLYVRKVMAKEAFNTGLDKDPATAKIVATQIEKLWAQARLEKLEANAGAEFDKNREKYDARAKELFAVDRASYATPEQVNVSHILIKTDRRSRDEALKVAQDVRAKAIAPGANFDALAQQYSEDENLRNNHASLGWLARDPKNAAITDAAFAMTEEGQVSEPIATPRGYEILLYKGRRPPHQATFDEVKDKTMTQLRNKYIEDAREAYFKKLSDEPTLLVNDKEMEKLKVPFDQEKVDRAVEAARKSNSGSK